MASPTELRKEMVERQIRRRGIDSPAILEAFGTVPRERFVPERLREFAYEDGPLPIGEEQTISQPYIVALMIEAAGVKPGDRILEVGAGTGYAAAVMSRIADEVIAIERHESLAQSAQRRVAELGYDNLTILAGDGSLGLPDKAPFDAVLVSAASERIPEALVLQLKVGGRLLVPVGTRSRQTLVRVTRTGLDTSTEDDLGGVRFVPLVAAERA